jgi:hypothetical protein
MAKRKEKSFEAFLEKGDNVEVSQLRTEINRLNKELSKARAGETILAEAVKAVFKTPPALKVPKLPKKDRRSKPEETAVLHISDIQLGKITDTYNSQVAHDRLMMLANKTIQITQIRKTGAKIENLRLYLGGDLVEGEEIFPTQAHKIDQSVFDQAVRALPEALAKVILRLLEEFRTIHIVTVPGNHGRQGSRATRANPRTNWDNVAHDVLKLWLLGPDDHPRLRDRVTMNVSESFWAVDRVYGWGNLLVHGDQIGGGFAGFPWYGTAKKAWGWIDSIPDPWDYLWFGHFHTWATATLNHRIFLANGTVESDNEFAQANLAAAGHPCQRLSFFNEQHGLISDHAVYLGEAGKRVPQRDRWEAWAGK